MSAIAGGVIDVIHGIEVRDPYRWLEDRNSRETDQWLHSQARICNEYFLRNHLYDPLQKAIRDTLSVEIVDQAARVGRYLFPRKQCRGEEQASIRVCDVEKAAEKILVDPAALGPGTSVEILHVSRDASLLAYKVRAKGTDAMEVHVVDVQTGIILPDYVPLAYGRGFTFDRLGSGFFYSAEPVQRTDVLSIRYHRFGNDFTEDISVFTVPWTPKRHLILLGDNGVLGALVTDSFGEEMVQDFFVTDEANVHVWKPVYKGMKNRAVPLISQGRIFLIDRYDSRGGSILELNEAGETHGIVVPHRCSPIQRCTTGPSCFFVSYLDKEQTRLEQWSLNGELFNEYLIPNRGSVEVFPSLSDESGSLFFLQETYTEAPSLWEIKLSERTEPTTTLLNVSEQSISAIVRQCSYTSHDGTRIPMVLIGPREDGESGIRPVVMMGYGGFGAAEKPRFSRFIKLIVELGVTVARPSIRGGSEFGEAWHLAAVRRNRQTAIDDFLAAAEWLQSEGLTDQRHLAIMGSSNGGLLVAAAAVQRPDLFEAVVCTGPLTDMVRYERFDRASKWRSEYGTAEDLDEFRALLSYSPYHNVKDTVDYPAMLVVSGDADDRCNPAHARKIVAAIRERQTQQRPILLDYGIDWGHVPTLSLTERTQSLCRKIAFLCEQLGISIEGDALHDVFDS
ncbi:prolyl oligopeptidase family serine peptidase [Acidicapsa ligni]|uniref:prolyl oligopeptidase family serine peptidase n=1 Tax=Acidicapsa ligni TaxID=542300 RepID=UPI0021E052E3|nr:prolyl oligopeptidase family serine peptidase [Acidicapsa ligni]